MIQSKPMKHRITGILSKGKDDQEMPTLEITQMLKLSDKITTSFYNFSHWDEGTHSHKGKIEELKRDLESVEKYLNGNFKTENEIA